MLELLGREVAWYLQKQAPATHLEWPPVEEGIEPLRPLVPQVQRQPFVRAKHVVEPYPEPPIMQYTTVVGQFHPPVSLPLVAESAWRPLRRRGIPWE